MLVLTRLLRERVRITLPDGRFIWVCIADIDRHKVRLGFDGPRDIVFKREEIIDKPERDK